MIVALLLALAATVTTGLMIYGAEEKAGPLAGRYAERAPASRLTPIPVARANGEEEQAEARSTEREHEEAETLERLHEIFTDLSLFLVILHVGGVVFTSLRERQNLVWAMITGRKRAPRGRNLA